MFDSYLRLSLLVKCLLSIQNNYELNLSCQVYKCLDISPVCYLPLHLDTSDLGIDCSLAVLRGENAEHMNIVPESIKHDYCKNQNIEIFIFVIQPEFARQFYPRQLNKQLQSTEGEIIISNQLHFGHL